MQDSARSLKPGLRSRVGQAFRVVLTGVVLLVLAACSSSYYRKSADDQTYTILQQYEDHLFGKTNAFTIETPYSGRSPEDILPEEIITQREGTNRMELDLEQTLNLAIRSSREYQTQKEQLYLTALSLTGTRHEFSPQFFGTLAGGLSGSGEGDLRGTGSGQVGVSQLLSTGGRLSVSLVNDLARYYTRLPVGIGRDSAVSLLTVNLTQPLLRGFGRKSPLVEQLTQSERNVAYAVRSYSQYQNQFAVNMVNDYFGLLNRKVQVRNFYTNYLRRADTTRYMEARAVDRQSANDVEFARSSELTARIQYVTAVAGYLDQLDAFKLRLGIPIGSGLFLADEDLTRVEVAGAIPVEISRDAAFSVAVEKHMDVLNAIDRFEDSKRKIGIAADQLRAGLDIVGNANVTTDTPDYTQFDPDQVRYSLGLQLDLPLDRLRERNEYRTTLISFESQLRSLSLTLDEFKDRIDRGLRSLEEARLNIESQQDQLRVELRRVDMSTIRLKAGRLNYLDLNTAQDALISAQNALTQRIVDYLRIRLQLLLDIGVLETAQAQFWLNDPLGPMLTAAQRGPTPLAMPRDTLIPPDRFLDPAR